jgi:ferredoxin
MNIFIISISPAGTTRDIALTIEKTGNALGHQVRSFDLGKRVKISDITKSIKKTSGDLCVFIGSPVYACHAVPPVMELISHLPERGESYSVPFVTYGVVTSGIALYEMANMLNDKGYRVIGAAKILTLHSLMWQVKNPLGAGHPDETDKRMIADLVKNITEKCSVKPVKGLSLSDLDYQSGELRSSMEKITLEVAKDMLPSRQVDQDRCTTCGECVEKCPVEAITCDPYPVFGKQCFLCYTCMRICPEHAITADFSMVEGFLREKAKEFTEQPPSKIFL